MRFLSTSTLSLHEFEYSPPVYCTASFGNQEFEQNQAHPLLLESQAVQRHRTTKLTELCGKAWELGFQWLWLPDWCVDWSSSLERDADYRWMFYWYQRSTACLVYLEDVFVENHARSGHSMTLADLQSFQQSHWFKQGWTLQALIAPKEVYFFEHDFKLIGTRKRLRVQIEAVTGIDRSYLDRTKAWNEASIATRMFWASDRDFPREEDEAYALIGILQADIIPDYGEGQRSAFYRLQCSVLEKSDDQSLFAWIAPQFDADEPFGLLAGSVRAFADSRDIECMSHLPPPNLRHEITAQGISFSRYLGEREGKVGSDEAQLTLRCRRVDTREDHRPGAVAIAVRRLGSSWYRVNCNEWLFSDKHAREGGLMETFFLAQPGLTVSSSDMNEDIDAYTNYEARRKRCKRRQIARQRERRSHLRAILSVAVPFIGLVALRVIK